MALDANGNVTASQLYAPYGGARYSNGTMPTDYGFTGQRADGATGLDYYGARYYDPTLGQFTSADTVSDGLNRYSYVGGNPETLTDPSGHRMCVTACTGNEVSALSPQQWAETYYTLAMTRDGAALSMALWSPSAWNQALAYAYYSPDVVNSLQPFALLSLLGQQALAYRQGRSANDWNASPDLMREYGVLTGLMVANLAAGGGGSVHDLGLDIRATGLPWLLAPRIREGASATPLKKPLNDGAGGVCSFSADTSVATPDGEQAIGTVQVGDQVKAYDPATGKSSVQTVQHVWVHEDHDLLDVTLLSDTTAKAAASAGAPATRHHRVQNRADSDTDDNSDDPASDAKVPPTTATVETIHTTTNHPWLTVDRGWVAAGDLRPGETIARLDGATARVAAVRVVPSADIMYNLTVSHLHTFLVGIGQYVVHNICVNFGSNASKFDWDEIGSGHATGGARASQTGSNKTVFAGLNPRQVQQVVRGAWKARAIVGSKKIQWSNELGKYVTRQEWEGSFGGWTVRGWYNYTTDTVETAFPYFGP